MLVHVDQDVLLAAELELELLRRDVGDRPLLRLGDWVRLHLKLGWNYSSTRWRTIRVRVVDQQTGGRVRERYVSGNQICISDIAGEL